MISILIRIELVLRCRWKCKIFNYPVYLAIKINERSKFKLERGMSLFGV